MPIVPSPLGIYAPVPQNKYFLGEILFYPQRVQYEDIFWYTKQPKPWSITKVSEKNTSDSNPQRLNIQLGIFKNWSHIWKNSRLMILFALCNKTNAFILLPVLTMCFFFIARASNKSCANSSFSSKAWNIIGVCFINDNS